MVEYNYYTSVARDSAALFKNRRLRGVLSLFGATQETEIEMKLLFSILYVAAIGILSHYIGESIPRAWFSENLFPYKPFKWEKNGKIYERLGIRKWKTRLPDMSRVLKDMLPKRISYKATSKDIQALIKETCVAEFTHKALCVLSIGVYFIWKDTVGVILVLVCVLCNAPFILIQRYNRPNLIELNKRIIKREERKARALNNTVV